MSNIGVFIDVGNQFYCINKKFPGRKLNYKKYLEEATKEHELYRAHVYGSQLENEAVKFITALEYIGYKTHYVKPQMISEDKYRHDWDVGIAMDIVRCIHKLDIVILGSSDRDLVPLVEWVVEQGVRCIIFASGVSKDLKQVADSWRDIEENLLEEKINE